jgi:hypothetical protein
LPVVEEILRRLRSTYLDRCHHAAVILHGVAATARRRAEREPDANQVLGSLVDLLAYVSEPALKGLATRNRNEKPKPTPKKSAKPRGKRPSATADADTKPSGTSD